MLSLLFPVSLFLSASLLFIIQPMVGKILLPAYGGTPSVWTVCVLFFQTVLLIAYAYAWLLSRVSNPLSWRIFHGFVCFISLGMLPLFFKPALGESLPELCILKNLFLQLGLPLLVIGSSAPLLQSVFSRTSNLRARDPYFLYAASNMGSLLALFSYPWIIERFWGISNQFFAWNIIYLIYLGFLFVLLYRTKNDSMVSNHKKYLAIAWKTKVIWSILSFIPCSLMLGVTFYISTDVAATPIFWVFPLALYLLSYILVFAEIPLISHAWVSRYALWSLVLPMLSLMLGSGQMNTILLIGSHLLAFFMMALLCHGELMLQRPNVEQLPQFYFFMALGGVLAGLFNGLLAPNFFQFAYEYPLIILIGVLCFPNRKDSTIAPFMTLLIVVLLIGDYYMTKDIGRLGGNSYHLLGIIALGCIFIWPGHRLHLFVNLLIFMFFVLNPWLKPTDILAQKRNFYGVKQVFAQHGAHVLMSQNTLHGYQMQGEKPTDGARAYYAPVLPVVQYLKNTVPSLNAMVLGLGTGILACQFRKNDQLTMVEIDAQVIDIAKDNQLFTYLRDCPPSTQVKQQDGRLAVAEVPHESLDLLVMDAFNSDAIPVHLMTLDAFKLYQKKLRTHGAILVNISNRHLRVLPILTGIGQELGLIVLNFQQSTNHRLGQLQSEWVLLTMNESLTQHLLSHSAWRFVNSFETAMWTDDYSNLIPFLTLKHQS